ncbi:SDR family NAD(P)-dependent oxidoreductase [Paenibacillus lentus]|uniref:SDR family NAD(P)-dependent oxidoreductase n=1 Tax=Paenibacillus lentus TaxID=1338368 RepID=A0A3Q8S706_9BACL|nr:SDR family NAD(P)-dependent oxidoreductase [Paenibacillus lentus]AZK48663.1 SDR family NAD(P)-dependent oxidoreductase [Paenibacillus lentus]
MHSKKHIRLISDIEKTLKKTKFIKEFRVTAEENLKGNQVLHVKDWLPTASHLERGEANFQSAKQKNPIDRLDDSLPWAISHGEPIKGSNDTTVPINLSDMLIQAAAQSDTGIMYILEDGSEQYISYPELLADAKRILRGLRELGLKPQDKVIFQFNKNENFVPAFWACVLGGFISVPVGTALSYQEHNADTAKLLNIWKMLNRPVILTDASSVDDVTNLKKLWSVDELVIAAAENLREHGEEQDLYVYDEDDYVLFLFTSGSTGKPKCVRHKNRSIVSRTIATVQMHAFQSEEVLLNWMPLEHVGGLVMYHILGVNLGCKQLLPRIDSFISQPLNWLKWMDAYQVTLTWAPNFAFSLINELEADLKQGQWDLSSVRHILNGGEAIVPKTAKQFLNLLRKFKLRDDCIFPSFGMSETSSGIVYSHRFRSAPKDGVHYVDKLSFHKRLRFGEQEETGVMCFTEVGGPLPGVSIRITDDMCQLVKEQHIGRVQVSGPTIMAGYDQNPEANEEAFTKDGWFDTGDLGFIKDGKLTITGRQKDIIIVNGNNFYNYEIEAIVGDVYGVLPTYAAAVPLTDPMTGMEELILFFSPADDKDLDYISNIIMQIRRVVSTSLGINPKYIIPVKRENFSRTESGKIQRNAFAERFNRGEFEDILRLLEVKREEDMTLPEWFYTREWSASPSPENSLPSGTCLIFNDSFGLGLAWASQIKRISDVIIVDEGQRFEKKAPHHYIINPKLSQDYNMLMEHLSLDHLHIDHVFHLWAFQQDNQQKRNELENLKEAQFKGSYSLLNLMQALNEHGVLPSTMTVIAPNASWFRHGDEPFFENATLPGLVKTLGYEYPQMTSTFIDIDGSSPLAQLVEIISKEWQQLDSSIVMYRQDQRYVPKLRKLKANQQYTGQMPLIRGGMYLITGGLGGVGALIAQYLIEHHDANIVIIGKTSLDEKHQANEHYADRRRTLERLQELGTRTNQVIYAQADVSSWSNLNAVLQQAFVMMNTDQINGMIHLAGIYEERLMTEQSVEFLDFMYETKVWGTYNMARLLEQYPDAMLVTSSSTSSIASGYGISAYSSANTFVEWFTEYLADKYKHVYCLAWSLWSQIGLGKQFNNMQEMLHKRGHIPITSSKGMYSFEFSLSLGEPLVYIGLDQASPDIVLLSKEAVETEILITVEFTTHDSDSSLSELYDSIRMSRGYMAEEDITLKLRHLGSLDEGRQLAISETKEEGQGIEKQLVHLLSALVQQEHVNAHDNFFDVGGNSLKAARLLSNIQSSYGVSISLRDFMENPTMSGLASRIRTAGNHLVTEQNSSAHPDSPARTKHNDRHLELTPSQLGQWILHQANPSSPCYNITFTLRFDGMLDISTLLKSVEALVKNQDALRMLIKLEGDHPRISIENNVVIGIPVTDLSALDPGIQEEHLAELIRAEANKPFNLTQDALSRFTMIKLSDYRHVLLGSMHHIISDGWSVHVLTEEIIRYYTELNEGNIPEPKGQIMSYGDFIEGQRSWFENSNAPYTEQLGYWKKALAIDVPPISLPLNYTRPPVQTYNGTILEYETGEKLASKISDACRCTKTSKYMFLLTIFATLLYRYSGQDRLRIGTVMANRNWPYSDEWIGYLANTLALDIGFTGAPTFDELLTQVKNVVLEAHEHQSIPLEIILRELKIKPDAARSPLFQVVFTVQNAQQSIYNMKQGTARLHIEANMTSKYDLSLHVYETEEDLQLRLEYNTDLFTEQTMQAFLEHYINMAESAADYCRSVPQSN